MPIEKQIERKMVEVPPTVHHQFKRACLDRAVTMKDATEQAIRAWIKAKPERKRERELQAA